MPPYLDFEFEFANANANANCNPSIAYRNTIVSLIVQALLLSGGDGITITPYKSRRLGDRIYDVSTHREPTSLNVLNNNRRVGRFHSGEGLFDLFLPVT
jgi:hypothetical protein